jgi:hypothetical protein
MTKNRKPTMNEVKDVINNMLIELSQMSKTMRAIDSALASYVEFKGDSVEWSKWVQEKIDENKEKLENDARSEESGDSSRGAGTVKTDKQPAEKSNKKTRK